jgi:hypothetical protein
MQFDVGKLGRLRDMGVAWERWENKFTLWDRNKAFFISKRVVHIVTIMFQRVKQFYIMAGILLKAFVFKTDEYI